jgi:hypothetical protein
VKSLLITKNQKKMQCISLDLKILACILTCISCVQNTALTPGNMDDGLHMFVNFRSGTPMDA